MAVPAPLNLTRSGHVVIGVDTHKHVHVAAVMDSVGGILSSLTIATDNGGYQQLLGWATEFGQIIAFGIEGTGSYGAGLTSFIRRNGHRVVEVNRPDRRMRRLVGKSDTLDAENAARAVLAGFATAEPKTADGTVEMIRQLKVAHDTAVKDRSSAMITLKAMLIHSSDQLRQDTARKTQVMLARHLASLRPTRLETPDDSIRYTLRSLARRWITLDTEASELETIIEGLVLKTAPQLVESFGIGADTAAEILIVVGDNPERIKSEAALAKLAGISPIPASSGMTSGRHRINHGGHRQLNAAIYRTVIVRMRFHQPTIEYVTRRTTEGLSKRDIIRCLKRYVIREVFHLVCPAENAVLKTSCQPYRSINAMMESFWSSMQIELLNRKKWRTRLDLANAIFDYIEIFYNRQRRHSQLGYLSPVEHELRFTSTPIPRLIFTLKQVTKPRGRSLSQPNRGRSHCCIPHSTTKRASHDDIHDRRA